MGVSFYKGDTIIYVILKCIIYDFKITLFVSPLFAIVQNVPDLHQKVSKKL